MRVLCGMDRDGPTSLINLRGLVLLREDVRGGVVIVDTARDIWTGRTWCRATFSPGTRQQASSDKKPGRPKGSRDSKPRKKKSTIQCHYVEKGRTSRRADTLRFNNITHTKDSQPQQKSISAQQPIAQTVNTYVPINLSIVTQERRRRRGWPCGWTHTNEVRNNARVSTT